MPKKYRIELTEEQMRFTEKALEEWMRLRMGQDMDLTNDMASINRDLSPENPNHKMIFDQYVRRRDHLRAVMTAFFRIAFEPYGYLTEKTDEMMVCECIWDAVRFYRGNSRWSKPFQIGSEPSPKIEVIKNE